MLFCPLCGNLLLVDKPATRTSDGNMRFYCQTCPFLQPIEEHARVVKQLPLTRKKADDVLGGDKAWDNVDQTDTVCPDTDCGSRRAYFMQIQIRSADEPMTIFYKCVKCKGTWSQN